MNWEVNVGSLLIVASIIFSAGGFYAVSRRDEKQNKIDVDRISKDLKDDINDIKSDLKALNKVVMDVALQNQRLDQQEERLNLLDKRFDELRRGEGLITERRA
jgi:hypothetical protein